MAVAPDQMPQLKINNQNGKDGQRNKESDAKAAATDNETGDVSNFTDMIQPNTLDSQAKAEEDEGMSDKKMETL